MTYNYKKGSEEESGKKFLTNILGRLNVSDVPST
jgi:hypothetical protein